MLEAKITCLVRSHVINDLGRTLLQGEVLYLSKEEVECSKELQRARVIRAVHIQWVQRCQQVTEPKSITPPFLRRLKGNLPTKEVIREVVDRDPNLEELRQVVRQVVSEELGVFKDELLAAFSELVGSLPGRPVGGLSGKQETKEEFTTPTFVPSGIVKEDLDVSISAKTEVQSRTNLDSAAQALRAAKKSGGLKKNGEEN